MPRAEVVEPGRQQPLGAALVHVVVPVAGFGKRDLEAESDLASWATCCRAWPNALGGSRRLRPDGIARGRPVSST